MVGDRARSNDACLQSAIGYLRRSAMFKKLKRIFSRDASSDAEREDENKLCETHDGVVEEEEQDHTEEEEHDHAVATEDDDHGRDDYPGNGSDNDDEDDATDDGSSDNDDDDDDDDDAAESLQTVKPRVFREWTTVREATPEEMGPNEAVSREKKWKAFLRTAKTESNVALVPSPGRACSTHVVWECVHCDDVQAPCTYLRKVNKRNEPWLIQECGKHSDGDAKLRKFKGTGVGSFWLEECTTLLMVHTADKALIELQTKYETSNPEVYAIIPSVEKLRSLRVKLRRDGGTVTYVRARAYVLLRTRSLTLTYMLAQV